MNKPTTLLLTAIATVTLTFSWLLYATEGNVTGGERPLQLPAPVRDLQALERSLIERTQRLLAVAEQVERNQLPAAQNQQPPLLGSEQRRPVPPAPPLPPPAPPPAPPSAPPPPSPPADPPPPQPAVRWWEAYQVSLIYAAERNSHAVVNGRLVTVGDALNDTTQVAAIEAGSVWVVRGRERRRISLAGRQP